MKYKEKIFNLFTDHCKNNNKIEIYFDPYYDPDDVYYLLYENRKEKTPCGGEYITKHKYNYDEFIDHVIALHGDIEIDYINDYINDFVNGLSEPLKKYYKSHDNDILYGLQDILYDYVDVEYPITDILNLKIKVNLFFKKDYDGFLAFLLHTQNMKIKDHIYLKKLLNNKKLSKTDRAQLEIDYKNNLFLKSLIIEIRNLYLDSYYQFCIIAKVTIRDYFNLLLKNKDFFIDKNCYCGLVDKISGGGSVLNIELLKDIKINTDMVDVYIENIDKYTVDDIYGLTGSCFKQCVKITDSYIYQ